MPTGLRTPTASGPIFSRSRSVCRPIAVASANASNDASSPIHSVSIPAGSAASGDLDRLLVGAVEPERHHDAEPCRSQHPRLGRLVEQQPSRSAPRSSGLTWKCAVAVCASRKRRCSGEVVVDRRAAAKVVHRRARPRPRSWPRASRPGAGRVRISTETGSADCGRRPRLVDRVVVERARRAQRRLGLGDGGPSGRALRERAARSLPDLAGGQSREVVDRAARVTERCGGDRQREEARRSETGTARRRSVGGSSSEKLRCSGTNTSSATASWLPVPRRPPVCQVSRISSSLTGIPSTRIGRRAAAVRLDHAPAEQVVGVRDPAAERPPARHAIAAVDAPRDAARRPHAGGDACSGRRTPRPARPAAASRRAGCWWRRSTRTSRPMRRRARSSPRTAASPPAAPRERPPPPGRRRVAAPTRAARRTARRAGAGFDSISGASSRASADSFSADCSRSPAETRGPGGGEFGHRVVLRFICITGSISLPSAEAVSSDQAAASEAIKCDRLLRREYSWRPIA